METLLRVGRYFRSPLVVCGTYNSPAIWQGSFVDLDDIPLSFYHLLGRNFGLLLTVKQILALDSPWPESSLSETMSDVPSSIPVENDRRLMYTSLRVPSLTDQGHRLTPNIERLLEESKGVVPTILDVSLKPVEQERLLRDECGFALTGSAEGGGFSCSVYRKELGEIGVPVYVITGDLDISVESFHALACDVEFRHEWDDQFHRVDWEPVNDNVRLLRWIVKWPWPLAPRQYTYLLTPHLLEDGTRLVMSASVTEDAELKPLLSSVPVKEYFGVTAAKAMGEGKCRYCVFHFDDPRLPGKMPAWVETYVAKSLLPSFPKKILQGVAKYPSDRLEEFANFK